MTWQYWLAGGFALATCSPALAHPHAWIDLESHVLLNDSGEVRALELVWLFDDYYTVLVAEELALKGEPNADYLNSIGERNLSNLRDYDYFTAVMVDGERQVIGDVTRYETSLVDGRLRMTFEVPLVDPVDPSAGELTFSVYDPTYYIEVVHVDEQAVAFDGQGAERCSGDIRQPNPTLEQVSLAASLDKDETAGDGLGELFAETVVVRCG